MNEKVHADRVQERLGMCLELIEILGEELVGAEPEDPRAKARVTTHARKLGA